MTIISYNKKKQLCPVLEIQLTFTIASDALQSVILLAFAAWAESGPAVNIWSHQG